MKIALLTFYLPNYQEVADLTLPIKDKYCAKNGYTHIVKVGPYFNESFSYDFQRLQFIFDIFWGGQAQDLDYVFCSNVSHVIMNHNIKIEDIVADGKSYYIGVDINGENEGASILKKDEFTKKWIEYLMSLEPQYHNDCWTLQRAIQHHIGDDWVKDHVKRDRSQYFNKYYYDLYNWDNDKTEGGFHAGDFVLGLPGVNREQRLDIIKSDRVQKGIIW